MADRSKIEWTDATWNPVTGCTKVSPGCSRCYAEAITLRFKRGGAFLPGQTTINLHPDRLEIPERWKRPRRIFVCSMSDLFHEEVPDAFIMRVFKAMLAAPQHTYQVLSKRSGRMADWLELHGFGNNCSRYRHGLPDNIWLGTSVESQYWADRRVPDLLECASRVRYLSVEPLLRPVDLSAWLDRLDWVIVGGESGPKHRPMNPEWARALRDQCVEAEVPFFFKQWGGHTPKAGGRLLDDREWNEMPERAL